MKLRPLTIRFRTAVHQGSGFGIAGLVDRAILRGGDGTPYLSGSAIKGKIRHAVLRLLLANGQSACYYGDKPMAGCADSPCALCVMFGSLRQQGRLILSDAYPEEPARNYLASLDLASTGRFLHADSSVRASTAIDRGLGTVRGHLLFTTETLPPFLAFESTVSGDLENVEQEKLLEDGVLILTHFVAGGARGLGLCDWHIGDPR